MIEMKLEITQDHIDAGLKGNCRECPIALALIDAGYSSVHVYSASASGVKDFALHYFSLHSDAMLLIGKFDNGCAVAPQTVHLLKDERLT